MGDERGGKERDILALAEGVKAMLIGRGWEVPGYWRWETKRQDPERRAFRAYYDVSNAARPLRIPSRDAPTEFRLLTEIAVRPQPKPKPPVEEPFDIGKQLEAFEARLLLALRVDDALPDRERGLLAVRILWPATSAAPGDYPTGISTRFRPTRAQIDDWFDLMNRISGASLTAEDKLILKLKAHGYPFRSIGTHRGVRRNEARTRAIYRAAVTECFRVHLRGKAGGRKGQRAAQRVGASGA